MEQLHGVLMHGDDAAGADHAGEDAYLRLQAHDAERAAQIRDGVGPCAGECCFLRGVVLCCDATLVDVSRVAAHSRLVTCETCRV